MQLGSMFIGLITTNLQKFGIENHYIEVFIKNLEIITIFFALLIVCKA